MEEVNEVILDIVEVLSKEIIKNDIKFVFSGSVSTLLQGCKVEPGDIDILVSTSGDVKKIISLFSNYLEDEESEDTPESWMASKAKKLIRFEDPLKNNWTLSRFNINHIDIEIANIRPSIEEKYIKGTGLWENGPHICTYIKHIPFRNIVVPVIPLEIQLETNLNRKKHDRVEKIINIFNIQGYDQELLDYSLSNENKKSIVGLL
ncbi:nucleotidyltransferase family protein [Heyndrickxia oleronia]|uniref:hypothetical protein n=1 Tax=Heyndrickxia oleronia TaxID=38875 RepID=UPI001B09F8F4|nr:hypothetical protein [Heyndrickxia oleronia]GIN38438.1 hypothetical protein J19TS1_13870 [Heyndrickxia oleronia]